LSLVLIFVVKNYGYYKVMDWMAINLAWRILLHHVLFFSNKHLTLRSNSFRLLLTNKVEVELHFRHAVWLYLCNYYYNLWLSFVYGLLKLYYGVFWIRCSDYWQNCSRLFDNKITLKIVSLLFMFREYFLVSIVSITLMIFCLYRITSSFV